MRKNDLKEVNLDLKEVQKQSKITDSKNYFIGFQIFSEM